MRRLRSLLLVLAFASPVGAAPPAGFDGRPIEMPSCNSTTEKPHWNGTVWECQTDQSGTGGVPAGLITFVRDGQHELVGGDGNAEQL